MERVNTSYGKIVKRAKSSVSLPNWLKNSEDED
jgi:hypothetical protein